MDLPVSLCQLEMLLKDCRNCGLARHRTQVVFGRGHPHARLMLIGDGPGAEEDRLGQPFVGRAGQLLDKIIVAAQLPMDDIYITNVVKCRPPGNRLPNQEEVAACKIFLRRQLQVIKPRIIVCLGALATQLLISPEARITRDRGQWVQSGRFLIMPTFHPAALLRDENKKKPVWDDFKAVRDKYLELCVSLTEGHHMGES